MDEYASLDPLRPKYRRVVLKLSGEGFGYPGRSGISIDETLSIARQAKRIVERGVQLAIVVGAGNILRGAQFSAGGEVIKEATAHYMGMLATVLNALALQDALEQNGVVSRVQTSIEMRQVAEPYIRRRAIRHLEKGRVVIFAGGTGNPFFTTDTTAALRAAELEADVILMAKNGVDGVYSADPQKFPDAVRYETLTFMTVLSQGLGVMDAAATSLCMDNNIPIHVFSIAQPGNIVRAVRGDRIGTIVRSEKQ